MILDHGAPIYEDLFGISWLDFNLSNVMMVLVSSLIVLIIAIYRESETPAETEWVPELYGMDCRLRTWNGQQYNGLENREAIPTTRANIVILHLYR